MTIETERPWVRKYLLARADPILKTLVRWVTQYRFTSLVRRIVVLNFFGLAILVSGIFYLNQFRAGLIDAKVKSLEIQGKIIAAAVAASARVETNQILIDPDRLLELHSRESLTGESLVRAEDDFSSLEFPINPERVAPVLRHLVQPTGTRARIYNREGVLILDSQTFYRRGQILRYNLPSSGEEKSSFFERLWQHIASWFMSQDLPLYKDIGRGNGKAYSEVITALGGISTPIVRVNSKGEIVVSIAVPVQRLRTVLGVLLLSTRGGDIDKIVIAERLGIVRVSLVALGVTILLAFLLAGQIARPIRRLSLAAETVRKSVKSRTEIPDFTSRSDEIGDLSGALRDMTTALYNRIDAIESFAADVAHELKNPLTSLKSAVETFSIVKTKEEKGRLIGIIIHDIHRLDRLISDISDASRLDAKLVREESAAVDVVELIVTLASVFNDIYRDKSQTVIVDLSENLTGGRAAIVIGHDSRLGQVVNNLLDNALSFSPPGGKVFIRARRLFSEIEVSIEDEGPGIPADCLQKVFDRFYSDRPEEESFGKNSGLGLHISEQIIAVHGGKIWAENRTSEEEGALDMEKEKAEVIGSRFVIRLPAAYID